MVQSFFSWLLTVERVYFDLGTFYNVHIYQQFSTGIVVPSVVPVVTCSKIESGMLQLFALSFHFQFLFSDNHSEKCS